MRCRAAKFKKAIIDRVPRVNQTRWKDCHLHSFTDGKPPFTSFATRRREKCASNSRSQWLLLRRRAMPVRSEREFYELRACVGRDVGYAGIIQHPALPGCGAARKRCTADPGPSRREGRRVRRSETDSYGAARRTTAPSSAPNRNLPPEYGGRLRQHRDRNSTDRGPRPGEDASHAEYGNREIFQEKQGGD